MCQALCATLYMNSVIYSYIGLKLNAIIPIFYIIIPILQIRKVKTEELVVEMGVNPEPPPRAASYVNSLLVLEDVAYPSWNSLLGSAAGRTMEWPRSSRSGGVGAKDTAVPEAPLPLAVSWALLVQGVYALQFMEDICPVAGDAHPPLRSLLA